MGLQLLNTGPNKKNIPNAPRSHIKIAKIFKEKDVSQNLIKNVTTFRNKNAETSTKRHQDKSLNRYQFVFAATIVQLIMKVKKISAIPTFLISEPLIVTIQKMMLK